ncbi:hypothetical protein PG988_001990 [Apiospora saccharicola]
MDASSIKPNVASSIVSYHGVSLHHQTILWVLLLAVAVSNIERVSRHVISGLLIELLSVARIITEMLNGLLARVDNSRGKKLPMHPPLPADLT